MTAFLETLERAAAGLHLPRSRVVVGVSGGADSMALLRGLKSLAGRSGIELFAAHLNHQLREAAEADVAWLGQASGALDVPLAIGRADVREIAERTGRGIEETARDERYRFLEQTALENNCAAIALAHTADDQAETILHHLLRGTGLAGLAGIPRARPLGSGVMLVRPLLETTRAQIIDYLAFLGQSYREDESNSDPAYTRNRLRHQLLPLLTRDYNPQVGEALRRLGRQAEEVQSALAFAATELLERALDSAGPRECRVKWQPLAAAPSHLVRELFAQLWRRQEWPRQAMTFDHWNELARIAASGGASHLPGQIEARREGRHVVLARAAVR